MKVNIWLAVRATAHAAIKARLQHNELTDGAYAGPVPNWVARFFRYVARFADVERIFRTDRRWFEAGAVWRNWTLWSLNVDLREVDAQRLHETLQDLLLQYPNMIEVVGAWHWDGRQVGISQDGTGVPLYPINSRILEYIPDEEDGSRPTAPKDVNLVFGQSPRQFS